MSRVLIVIPAYNESETIAEVVGAIRREAPGCDIAVVDDGSTDATAPAVAALEGVELLELPFNLGIGGAMQTGYKYALRKGYDIVVQCDADGQHPVERIKDLVAYVESGRADLVIGSRYVADTNYRPTVGRRVGKSILSRTVDAIVGGGITDTTSGFRAANRAVFSIFARSYPEDYPEPEVLVILHKSGLRVVEMPVEMRARQGGRTSIDPLSAAYYMVKVGLALFVNVFRTFPSPWGGR